MRSSRSPFKMKTILSSDVDELLLETRDICKRKWALDHVPHRQRDQELFCVVVICETSIDTRDAIPVGRRRIKPGPWRPTATRRKRLAVTQLSSECTQRRPAWVLQLHGDPQTCSEHLRLGPTHHRCLVPLATLP